MDNRELADQVERMVETVTGHLLGCVEDIRKGKWDWAMIALDEAGDELGRVTQLVEEAYENED